MSSPILESLPAIHATVIGVVAAFFSAFAIFAFQRVNDAKDKVEKSLKDAEEFGTPDNYIGAEAKLFNDDGLLDWDGCGKRLLHEAKAMFSNLDSKAKYGYDSGFSRDPSDEQISKVASELMLFMHYVFTTYPFNGRSMVRVDGVTDKAEEHKKKPFDIERLNELSRRISFLSWCWQTGHLSILEVVNRYGAIQEAQDKQRRDETLQLMLASIPEEYKEETCKHYNQHPTTNIDYLGVVTGYFDKVLQYEQQVIPVLSEVLLEYKKYNERFKIKQWSLLVVKLIVFILVIGVCLPLIALDMLGSIPNFNWNGFWVGWFEYFILFSTISPYLYACWYCNSKLKGMSFE